MSLYENLCTESFPIKEMSIYGYRYWYNDKATKITPFLQVCQSHITRIVGHQPSEY